METNEEILMSEEVRAGQAVFTPLTLMYYDYWVHGFGNHVLWRCPTREILAHYDRNISGNHLDVGVGTGYFLDRCRFPTDSPRIYLMDLNPNPLEVAARRIQRYRPKSLRRNVLAPISFDGEPFESIGLSYLFHCLPGTIPTKAVVFDHLRPLLRPGGVMFGATILSGGVERWPLARLRMEMLNAKHTFSNSGDTLADLRRALEERFHSVSLRAVGCVALFSART